MLPQSSKNSAVVKDDFGSKTTVAIEVPFESAHVSVQVDKSIISTAADAKENADTRVLLTVTSMNI